MTRRLEPDAPARETMLNQNPQREKNAGVTSGGLRETRVAGTTVQELAQEMSMHDTS
jgi:hypothetical protein